MAREFVRVEGAKQLNAWLTKLDGKMTRSIVRKAVRQGGKVILAKARELAPVGQEDDQRPGHPGLVKRSLSLRKAKTKRRSDTAVRIFINNVDQIVTVTKAGKRHFYPTVLEYGTATQAAHPFLRPAFDSSKNQALQVVVNEMQAGVQGAIRELRI